jgi:NADH dehydrogenase FAD-containing subunit
MIVFLEVKTAQDVVAAVQWLFDNYHWKPHKAAADDLRARIGAAGPDGVELSCDLAIRLRDDVQTAWTNRREPGDHAALSVLNELTSKVEHRP